MLYVPANVLLVLRFVLFLFFCLMIAINVKVYGAFKILMLHHIEDPTMEDLYNPNNQKVLLLSRAGVVAAVTFHSSNFNKTFRVLS